MDDLRVPCLIWFDGDPPPDLSGLSQLVRIPFMRRVGDGRRMDASPTIPHAPALLPPGPTSSGQP